VTEWALVQLQPPDPLFERTTMDSNEPQNSTPSYDARPGVGAGYARGQMAKALTTQADHHDAATRERAGQRVADWARVFSCVVEGDLRVGSRTPLEEVPPWATLRVLTGGFTTGELLAAGQLTLQEVRWLRDLEATRDDEARSVLNRHFLSAAGLEQLLEMLHSGCYDIDVPEAGALPVVAWLVANGHHEKARDLVAELAPWLSKLRFYPFRTNRPRQTGSRVSVQTVGQVVASLQNLGYNSQIAAQQEAINVWAPLYERAVKLFLETVIGDIPYLRVDANGKWERGENGGFPVIGGWPCQHYPGAWRERAAALLNERDEKRGINKRCGRMDAKGDHVAMLWSYLLRCVMDPEALTGRDVGRIRMILACNVARRGTPDSPSCSELRARQAAQIAAPVLRDVAAVVIFRLLPFPQDEGIESFDDVLQPVAAGEHALVPAGTPIAAGLQRRVHRCLRDTVDVLVERGLITSFDTLATVLPQVTAEIRAAAFPAPELRRLNSAIYEAFRRRRSLLLQNFEKQVQLSELPWMAALETFRPDEPSGNHLAHQALREFSLLGIVSFPHAILPNKLLQELRQMAQTAGLDLPLVEELAVDIFMGRFTPKFEDAARHAAELLEGSLYARYYNIDYAALRTQLGSSPSEKPTRRRKWIIRPANPALAELCASRAGVSSGFGSTVRNGMIIEQQQILTTQNLAVLFSGLHLADALGDRIDDLPWRCFLWVCDRQQVKVANHHARLIQLKNAAYAWRQMIFYLSLMSPERVAETVEYAHDHFIRQPAPFRERFLPAYRGLMVAIEGGWLDDAAEQDTGARKFLGWSQDPHWLLADD